MNNENNGNHIEFLIKILLVSQLIGMICLWITNWVKSPLIIFLFFSAGGAFIGLSLLLWSWTIIRAIKKELFSK